MLSQTDVDRITEQNYNDVYRFCYSKTLDKEASLDLTQDVFVLLNEKREQLEDCNISAWLYSVVNIKAKKYLKLRSSDPVSIDDKEVQDKCCTIENLLPEAYISDEDILLKKETVLGMLSRSDRDLFEDIFVLKKTNAEVAEKHGISYNALTIRVCRLKKTISALVKCLVTFVFVMLSVL